MSSHAIEVRERGGGGGRGGFFETLRLGSVKRYLAVLSRTFFFCIPQAVM